MKTYGNHILGAKKGSANPNKGYWTLAGILLVAAMLLTLLMGATSRTVADAEPYQEWEIPWTNKMLQAHIAADCLRALGYEEGSQEIQALSMIWWAEKADRDYLASLIRYEAGSYWLPDEQRELTGMVVLNRVKDSRYPDTIYGVITQPGQYMPSYVNGPFNNIPRYCYDAAVKCLNGLVECPDNVIFQSEGTQGVGIYKKIPSQFSTTYFCYGSPDPAKMG